MLWYAATCVGEGVRTFSVIFVPRGLGFQHARMPQFMCSTGPEGGRGLEGVEER